jgi:hypothetical protein
VDLDEIISRLTKHSLYSPEHAATVRDGIRARNRLIESLPQKAKSGQSIWVIVGAPDPRDRAVWIDLLKPQAVYIALCPMDECMKRIDNDNRRMLVAEDQKRAVIRWYERYKELPEDQIISTGSEEGRGDA